ncbi:serpin family protein [Bacteroidetes/Chlorobi group bacterium MS-B_bin-24]|nr:MAG: serpin family protein [Bacteroidetes/Chlorobi group bacterium MS-B_bin-24]
MLILILSCNDISQSIQLSPENEIVQPNNIFALKLFREVNRQEGNKNIVLSPLSVSFALGVTVNGAAGATRDSILRTLELNGFSLNQINESYQKLMNYILQADSKVQFELANSIWYYIKFPFKQSFFDLCKLYYNSLVSGLDFEDPKAPDIINDWVNKSTKGKIKEIIKEISGSMDMYLINAIYFKGNWVYMFDLSKTKKDIFYLLDGTTKMCDMMNQKVFVPFYSSQKFQAVDLPYGDKNFSMTIFLPADIDDFINELTDQNYRNWLTEFGEDSVGIIMPKLKVEYDITLDTALQNLGMGLAFDCLFADFSSMSYIGVLCIGKVKHKTYLSVDQQGTEASAASAVEIIRDSYGPEQKIIKLNRPFVFVIRERKTGEILFIGKIVEPDM